jgi:predicted membrane protein (TIGR00267 family)
MKFNSIKRMGINNVNLRVLSRIGKEVGPILRRFFINTLFDSTFMQLGIIIGSASTAHPDLRLVIGTLISSSVALGISTGISVYESETLERERRVAELEKALFRNLDNTMITENYRTYAVVLSIVNFLTPFACCGIVVIPLILAMLELLSGATASWISILLALSILFVAGTYLGRLGRQNPLIKGLRMTAFGILAFVVGFLIQTLI